MTDKVVRADRLLSNLGYGSRKDMARAVRDGWLEVDGERLTDPSSNIEISAVRAGRVVFDDQPLDPPAPLTVMFHKPVGYTCSLKDAGPIVYDLLPERWRLRNPVLSPMGRLDKYSSGQLLFTDDGELLHRITHPRTHASKYYKVELRDDLRGNEAALFATGDFMLKDEEKPLKPASLTQDSAKTGIMILSEGRYHQIRRMFEMLGNEVVSLHRYRTGGLEMGDIAEGQWCILEDEQINRLLTV